MKTETMDWPRVAEALDDLRRELGRLGERVAALEAAASAPAMPTAVPPPPPAAARPEPAAARPREAAPAPSPPAAANGLDEELVLVIGAAIAAFLGKKAHIRQIEFVGSAVWAQQGRVTIQASHALSVHSPRSQP